MSKRFTLDELSRFIDHTNLKASINDAELQQLCQEAEQYHFKMVAINQVQSKRSAQFLKNTDVNIGAAISFPLGQTTIESKVFETKDAISNGATEIDYVINLTEVKNGNFNYVKREMEEIVKICRENSVISKVIFENAYLDESEIIKLSEISKVVKPDFIKTSTGMAPTGATIEDVRLMKSIVGESVKVKAAGGIRDADTFIQMIQNGAERIGTSSGIKIIQEIEKRISNSGNDYIEI